MVNKSEAISYAAYLAATDLYPASKPTFDALMAHEVRRKPEPTGWRIAFTAFPADQAVRPQLPRRWHSQFGSC